MAANQFLIDSQKAKYGTSVAQINAPKNVPMPNSSAVPNPAVQNPVPMPKNTPSTINTTVTQGVYGSPPKPNPTPVPNPGSYMHSTGTGPKPITNNVPNPVMNAATSTGQVPTPNLGYGGASYGTNAGTNRALEANRVKLNTDPNFKNSEIERAKQVKASRASAGLSTVDQDKYLASLGYNAQRIDETPADTPVPAPGYVPPVDMSQYTPLTPEQIAAEAQSRMDRLVQQRTTAANQAKQGIQTSFDRLQTNVGEDRALENNYNSRNLSPFSGRSDFAQGMIEQQRGRTDREGQQDLQTRLANIDLSVQDYVNASDEQRLEIENALIRQEREYGLQVDNQKYGQWADQRNFGYGQVQDMVNWTGNVPNGGGLSGNSAGPSISAAGGISGAAPMRTLAGIASDRAGQQMNIDNALAYGDRAGMILNPQTDPTGYVRQIQNGKAPLTYDAKADQRDFNYQVGQDKVSAKQWQQTFDRSKYESDRGYQFQVQQQAIQNGQWQQQFNQDVEKFGFQKSSEMWSQAFQENQAGQDDAYRKQTLEQDMSQADRQAASQAVDAITKSGLVSKTTDTKTGMESLSVTNPEALNKYIKSLNLSDNATDSLLYQYGLDSYVKK